MTDSISQSTRDDLAAHGWRLADNSSATGLAEMAYSNPHFRMTVIYHPDNQAHSLIFMPHDEINVYRYDVQCHENYGYLLSTIVGVQETLSKETLPDLLGSIVNNYPDTYAELGPDEWVQVVLD